MWRFGLTWLLFPTALLRGMVALVAGLTGLILLASASGHLALPLPIYLDTGDCSQPCWQGLHVGQTTVEEALALVQHNRLMDSNSLRVDDNVREAISSLSWEMRYFPAYDAQARFRSDLLMRLNLYPDGQLLLADVFGVFGPPSHAALCQRVATSFNYRQAVFATLYFWDGMIAVWAYTPNAAVWQVRPDMQVHEIVYHTAPGDDESWVPLGVARWHGFGRTQYSGVCR
jgi:hypothetical protein